VNQSRRLARHSKQVQQAEQLHGSPDHRQHHEHATGHLDEPPPRRVRRVRRPGLVGGELCLLRYISERSVLRRWFREFSWCHRGLRLRSGLGPGLRKGRRRGIGRRDWLGLGPRRTTRKARSSHGRKRAAQQTRKKLVCHGMCMSSSFNTITNTHAKSISEQE